MFGSSSSGFVISVKITSSKTITIEVQSSDTLAQLKEKIYDKERIVPLTQRLIFAGTEPSDSLTLSACGIKSGSILHLIHRAIGTVFPINIKTGTGKTITLHVMNTDTILQVKQKIQEEDKKLLPEYQILLYKGTELSNDSTLTKSEITEGSTLQLASRMSSDGFAFNVHIKAMGGKTMSLRLSSSDTVGNIKKKFQETEGVSAEQQKVVIQGVPRSDDLTLGKLGVTEGSTIFIIYRKAD